MVYTNREQLTIIELKNGQKSVSIKELEYILMERPSNIIYCELKGKLVGIISTGDIHRAHEKEQDNVEINKQFEYMFAGEYARAKELFSKKISIKALPVVMENQNLIGDYTRWDDLILMDNILNAWMHSAFKLTWKSDIVLVRPNSVFANRQKVFNKFKEYLKLQNVVFKCIEYTEVSEYLESPSMILFVDENELLACMTLFGIRFGHSYIGKKRMKTYRNFLGIENNINDRQCAVYLKELYDKGVNILGLTFDVSLRYANFLKNIESKFAAKGEKLSYIIPRSMYEGFFDELYNTEYTEQIMGIHFGTKSNKGVLSLEDCHSQYYNVIDGERYTSDQPEKPARNIYFMGPCYVFGLFVEDKNTMESFLQRRLKNEQFVIRVINCGSNGMEYGYRCLPRIAVTQIRKGDIIVVDRPPKDVEGVNYLSLSSILEKDDVSVEWVVDSLHHCNHKIYNLYANAIFDALVPILSIEVSGQGEIIAKDENYIKSMYLNQYFADFDFKGYNKIGSVVMNCNPFTYGHRYLIEKAMQRVDYLIIFVVEEDKSLFSFAERFSMVNEGISDMDNIMVVPSGPFILSQLSFPEYFLKQTSEDIVEHTEHDIMTFAEDIAPHIGVKYRFVGEEPEDSVTNQYNLAMKKILPKYGIELIEIPRKTINGKIISASSVRRYLEVNDEDRLRELLPDTTRKILGML